MNYEDCKTEQAFKMECLRRNKDKCLKLFCIETEMLKRTEDYAKCQNEQQFKMLWLKRNQNPNTYFFCIETEETVKGFPDVMSVCRETTKSIFFEFKFTKTGKIKFQPTQPAFYKIHSDMNIWIVAYNAKTKTLHQFEKNELFKAGNVYEMNDKAAVDLWLCELGLKKE